MGRPRKEEVEVLEAPQPVIEAPKPKADDHITVTLEALIRDAQKLLNWAATDRDYVKRSRNEAIFLAQKNQAILDAITSQQNHLENLKAQGSTIIADAQREAAAIKNAADDVLANAHRQLSEAKKMREDAERELSLARMKAQELAG